MNIIIVGCSKVGETLAAQLGRENNDVTVIDLSAEKINDITAKYDVMGIVGNGATHTTLVEAGIDKADLLIAVTDSDELNLLCCMIAKKSRSCRVIARVTSPEYNTDISYLKDELGLEMIINPQFEAAEEIARVLRFPAAIKIEPFGKGRVELITFKIADGSPLVGMKVKEIVTKLRCDVLVCTVERENEAYIPNGDFVFAERDVISVISSTRKAYNFFKKIESVSHGAKNVIIVGIEEVTHYLCETLRSSGMEIKVIDKNLPACDELASRFSEVTVINGDEADQDLLIEEGADRCDAFVALSSHDEENIILSLFAKKTDGVKVVTKIDRLEYEDIVKHLDLDTTIYPSSITADSIVRYVRAMKNVLGSNVETMYNIIKDKVEASEFYVREGSPIIGVPLMNLKFKNDVLVAAIMRGRSVIIPRGSDTIKQGDSVIIVTKLMALRDITDVLSD
ncbi:MAG: Trk system potassium transporter TrkA [Clostridia bacterium]|nr:Trk system potassium transporter TrkA [Clostridia bacterium]